MKLKISLLVFASLWIGQIIAQESAKEYFIQLAASRTMVSAQELQEKLALEKPVIMILHDGWYKYLFGPYSTHDLASSDLKARGLDGFVTRYENIVATQDPQPVREVLEEKPQSDHVITPVVIPPKVQNQRIQAIQPIPTLRQSIAARAAILKLVPAEAWIERPGNSGSIIDPRDSTRYGWIKLGDQVWMTQNVRIQMEGARIPSFDSLLPPEYGFLYNQYAAQAACPEGWHLPDDREWMALEHFLGLQNEEIRSIGNRETGYVGLDLKSQGSWPEAGRGLDRFGFGILPSGFVNHSGESHDQREKAYFWTNSRALIGTWMRSFDTQTHGSTRSISSPNKYYSVRCIRN